MSEWVNRRPGRGDLGALPGDPSRRFPLSRVKPVQGCHVQRTGPPPAALPPTGVDAAVDRAAQRRQGLIRASTLKDRGCPAVAWASSTRSDWGEQARAHADRRAQPQHQPARA